MPALRIPSVFVRGLPFSLTDEQLEGLFSAAVPVKRAFIIRDQKARTSRGFGFVQLCVPHLSGHVFYGQENAV